MEAKTPQEFEHEFYSKKYYLSYSALNKLLYSPNLFYKHYVLQQKDEKPEDYLVEGKVIHALMLGPEDFEKQFMVSPASLPGDSTKKIVDKIYYRVKEAPGLLENYTVEILECLKEINLHQSLTDDKKAPMKTGDEKRLEKILTDDAKSYFEFLKTKGDKILIDQVTLDKCLQASSALLSNPEVYHLLGLDGEMRDLSIRNEFPIQVESKLFPFGFKGILDNLVVDKDTKTLYINDLKTSGKTIAEFKETIEFYKYWIQAVVYTYLVRDLIMELEGDWKLVFTFIVIDKYNQIYCFEVSPETMLKWNVEFLKKVEEFKYHYENKSYTLPYEFLIKKVVL